MTALAACREGPDFAGQAPRLADRLRAFAAPVRVSEAGTLAEILRRIDETILPRALTLTSARGARLRLLVSNRRLMRVETSGETTADDDAPADPQAAAEMFAARLKAVAGDEGPISLTSSRYPADAFFWNVGCSAGRLARAMGADEGPDDAPGFESLLETHALARVELSETGRRVGLAAPPDRQPLLDRVLAQVPQGTGRPGGEAEQACIFVPVGEGVEAVIAGRRRGHAVALVPAGMRDLLIRAWQAEMSAPRPVA